MKKLLMFICIFTAALIFSASTSRADDFTDAMMKAKKNLQSAMNTYDEKALLKVRGEFERILQLKKHDWIVNYYIAMTDYAMSYTAMSEGKQDKEKMKKYTESALGLIDKSILVRDDYADSWILKLALNFNRWIYEPDKMNDIVAQSDEAKKKAELLEPDNPRLHLINGMSNYYTPEAFGGGVEKAVNDFEKSLELFRTRVEKEAYYPDWGKDMAYGYLALSYLKRDDEGDADKTQKTYDKGIEEFPDSGFLSGFVKKQLERMK